MVWPDSGSGVILSAADGAAPAPPPLVALPSSDERGATFYRTQTHHHTTME